MENKVIKVDTFGRREKLIFCYNKGFV